MEVWLMCARCGACGCEWAAREGPHLDGVIFELMDIGIQGSEVRHIEEVREELAAGVDSGFSTQQDEVGAGTYCAPARGLGTPRGAWG